MRITGLGWVGTRTNRDAELARFYEDVLGLRPSHAEPGFRVYTLPDGRNVEVFGPEYPGKEHLTTGPVAGFAVADLPAAVADLRAAGVGRSASPGRPGSTSAARTATSTS